MLYCFVEKKIWQPLKVGFPVNFKFIVLVVLIFCSGCKHNNYIYYREPLPIIDVAQDYDQLKKNVEHYNLFAKIENNKIRQEYKNNEKE
jgi:hypothetical protein